MGLFSSNIRRLNMFSALALAVFSVHYWDCQFSNSTKGLPSCDHEEVCSKVKGKTQCRDLPKADKCLNDKGKVCTKKTGETCRVVETPHNATTTTTTASPSLDYDDSVGCTIGEEIVCEAITEKPTYPECSKKEEVCKNVNGKPKCHEVTPEKCLSVTGKLCITEEWRVCGPGTSDDSDVIIGGE